MTKEHIFAYYQSGLRGVLLFFVFSMLSWSQSSAQQLSPLQTGHYLPGFSNVRDMAMPPPGFFVLWYNYYSTTNSYFDRNGNKYNSIPLSELDDRLPDIDLEVDLKGFATAPAFFWASNKKILGGARYMAGFVPVYFWADASFVTEARGGPMDTIYRESFQDKLSGISDFYFAPVTLSWGWSKADLTLAYGLTAPTGRYETGADDNIGLGFWTHQVQGFGYYYPVEDQSTALMLGLTYEMNGKVKDEDFNPGNRFSLEWGISQYLTDRLELGIQGGHNWQVVQDKGSEVFWDPGVLDKKSTLAFSAGYWVWVNKMQVSFKYGFDYAIVQRFKNNMFMLNATWVTGALSGNTKTR